jgi:hypothetical protein
LRVDFFPPVRLWDLPPAAARLVGAAAFFLVLRLAGLRVVAISSSLRDGVTAGRMPECSSNFMSEWNCRRIGRHRCKTCHRFSRTFG